MDQYYWNAYKRLENEVLSLAECIHVCDDQLKVYSIKIADLLVRASIEIESLVKLLYHSNGGIKPNGKDLYFDTDCFGLLESLWLISKKTIFVTAPNFYFREDSNRVLRPLYKSYKRGSSSSDWQKAYQAVKHDRVNNLKSGNLRNLILAMGALYIINIYYRQANYDNIVDVDGSNIDWGLGSELFSVKISPETMSKSPRQLYQKKPDYDECVYIIKHTDESMQKLVDFFGEMDKAAADEALNSAIQSAKAKVAKGKIATSDLKNLITGAFATYRNEALVKNLGKNKSKLHSIWDGLKLEAVLNTQQY